MSQIKRECSELHSESLKVIKLNVSTDMKDQAMSNSSRINCDASVGIQKRKCYDMSKVPKERELYEAASNGNYEAVAELLSSGVSADTENFSKLLYYNVKSCMTPLQISAVKGRDKCLQLLIDHGADVNAKDQFNVTALHLAAERGNYTCVKALLEARADCHVAIKSTQSYIEGTTALHLASGNNHVECVKELIQFGADYNALDKLDRTSLYIAAEAGFEKCMLSHLRGAVMRDILSIPSKTSDTPLHFAVKWNMVNSVKELLHLGSDANHINCEGYSPLHMILNPDTSRNKKMEILELLVLEGYKTNINHPHSKGYTPLHLAGFYEDICYRQSELAKFLITYGADVNIKNKKGMTLLECELQQYNGKQFLLKHLVTSMLYLPRLNSLNVCPLQTSDVNNIENPLSACSRQVCFMGCDDEKDDFDVLDNCDELGGLELDSKELDDLIIRCKNIGKREEENVSERRLYPQLYRARSEERISITSNMPSFGLCRSDTGLIFNMNRSALELMQLDLPHPSQILQYPVPIPAEQPLLKRVFQVVTCFIKVNNSANRNLDYFHQLRQQLWYDLMASKPRTLKHHCRYTIRKSMGPSNLKYIKNLPVPIEIQSYLLLKVDDK